MAIRGYFSLSVFCIGSVANFVAISRLSVAIFTAWLFFKPVAILVRRYFQTFRGYSWLFWSAWLFFANVSIFSCFCAWLFFLNTGKPD